jgi:hypothetical protein
MPDDGKPLGSGVFALVSGIVFINMSIILYICNIDVKNIDPNTLFRSWLLSGGIILSYWGVIRIIKGNRSWTVGQVVVGFIGAAIAILALLKQ